MNYEISFIDTDCEDFFCSIFSRNDLFSLIQETLEKFPETKVIVLDPIDCEKDNYIEPLLDGIFPKGTKLYLPVGYLEIKKEIKKIYNEEGWNGVVVNVGCGEARENSKVLENVVNDLSQITGQKPVITRARKSIANFKLREDMPIGAKVTLRGDKMWEFLDRLFNVALPRVRDFQGINPNSFDGRGNYALGIKEQLIFPEIEYDKIDKIRGMDVVICTTAHTDEEARALLEQVGAPFAR